MLPRHLSLGSVFGVAGAMPGQLAYVSSCDPFCLRDVCALYSLTLHGAPCSMEVHVHSTRIRGKEGHACGPELQRVRTRARCS